MNEIVLITIYYFIVFIIGFLVSTFFLRGFYWSYFRVRWLNPEKKLILIKFRTITQPFYKVGKLEEGTVAVKVGKDNRRYTNLPKNAIYRDMNIHFIEIIEDKGIVIDYSEAVKGVSGFDADKFNSLYLRALYKPSLLDTRQQIILVVLILVGLGMIYLGYMAYSSDKKLNNIFNEVEIVKNYLNATVSPRSL